MTNVAPGHATATLSGRELALQRRQAMARHGKAGTVSTAQTVKHSAAGRLQLNAAHLVARTTAVLLRPLRRWRLHRPHLPSPVTSKSAARSSTAGAVHGW